MQADHEALIQFLAARLHSVDAATEVAQEAYARLLHLRGPGAALIPKPTLTQVWTVRQDLTAIEEPLGGLPTGCPTVLLSRREEDMSVEGDANR